MKEDYSLFREQILNSGLNEAEAKKTITMLQNEKDHRSIDSCFIDDLCDDDGKIHKFLDKVYELNKMASVEEKLIVCFRKNKVTIYKNNHVLWDISRTKEGKYAVEINFDHARYCSDWESILEELKKDNYGFYVKEANNVVDLETGMKPVYRVDSNNKKTDIVTGGSIGVIRTEKDLFTKDFVDGTYIIFSKLISAFMGEGTDQFRKKIIEIATKNPESGLKIAENIQDRSSTAYIEKRWQQRLFNHFKSVRTGSSKIFVYDLEFSQKYPNDDIKKKLEANEPDMMAIQFDDNGNAEKLLLIEVKSKYSSCWSLKRNRTTKELEHKSDLWSHVKGMKAYCDMTFFIHSRIVDAYQILLNYYDMGLYSELDMKSIESVLNLTENDLERIILLTNDIYPGKKNNSKSAIDFINNMDMKQKLKKLVYEEDPQCKLWITTNNYYDENLIIDFNYEL